MWGTEGKKVEGESEPLVLVGVEGVERGRRRWATVVVVVMVRWTESEEGGRRLGGDEVYEARGAENLVEELADGAADHDLAKREAREDLV